MIRKAIEKIEELVNAREENKLEQVEIKNMLYKKFGGHLSRVTTPGIESIGTRSLSGLVEIIKSYIDVEAKKLNIQLPLIIQAEGNEIKVLSSVDDTYERQTLIHCKPVVPRLILNEWVLPEEMIINLNTCYVPTENTDKLIATVSNLYNSKTVKQIDNGVGVNLVVESDAFAGGAGKVTINPIVTLTPVATYPELIQIDRKFNLRVDQSGRVALFVADGGYFEKEVQRLIKQYLIAELPQELIGKDVVLAF